MIKSLIYDIEIEKAIPVKKDRRVPGIKYCKGWDDHENMGISTICAYTNWDDSFHVFCKDSFNKFQVLAKSSEEIIGFNSESFDDQICRAAEGLFIKTTYDILREVYKAIGLDPCPKYFDSRYKGYGLDALCRVNEIGGKIGHGALAPILWQQGKYGEVINYCLHDVKMTRDLLRIIEKKRQLISPHTGESFVININYNT